MALVIVIVGVFVYLNSLSNTFVFDDIGITDRLEDLSETGSSWSYIWPARRALVNATFLINYQLEGNSPVGYHLVNIMVHVGAALALFGVVRRTLTGAKLAGRYQRAAPWLAFVVALIWLVHPLNTQAVTYTVQRAESLMGLFYLLMMYAAIRLLAQPQRKRWLAMAFVCCLAGMMSKEVMVTAPVMVVLYDRVFADWPWRQQFRRRGVLYVLLALTWLWLPIAGVGDISGAVDRPSAGFAMELFNWWQYALTQAWVVLKYIVLSFWPSPLILDRWQLARHTLYDVHGPAWATFLIAWPVLVVLVLLVASLIGTWRRKPIGFVGMWFFLILAPTSSIIPIADMMFEHRMYLSLAAVVALVAIGCYRVLLRPLPVMPRAAVGAALTAAVVGVFSVLTVTRNTDYAMSLTIWQTVVRDAPHNPRAWYNLGESLRKKGQLVDAQACFNRVLELAPNSGAAYYGLGMTKLEIDSPQAALGDFQKAVQLSPDDAVYQYNLGLTLLILKRFDESEAAFRRAIELRPEYPKAYNNLGIVLMESGRPEEAIASYQSAIEQQDDFLDAHWNLTNALAKLGRDEEAAEVRAKINKMTERWK